jgi:hypothetical protein
LNSGFLPAVDALGRCLESFLPQYQHVESSGALTVSKRKGRIHPVHAGFKTMASPFRASWDIRGLLSSTQG